MIARVLHPTDLRILDGLAMVQAEGGEVTIKRLATASGLTWRTVKKRRLLMVRAGVWPTMAKVGKYPPEVVARARELRASARRATYPQIARRIAAEIGRPIHPRTVERFLSRPERDGLEAAREAIRAEALREYQTRHDPRPYRGESASSILRRCGLEAKGDRHG